MVLVYLIIFPGKWQSSFLRLGESYTGGEYMKEKTEKLEIPKHFFAAGKMPAEEIRTDPMGSYTGLVSSPGEKPVQDADDL